MITRIIKFKIDTVNTDEFKQFFTLRKNDFSKIEGCKNMEILNDKEDKDVYFMYTIWETEFKLNKYRKSELNKTLWTKLNVWSVKEPQAWTVENVF
ncbi:MAG: antibiotic biosynthesis monooxygenase [Bacteroidales bacterium]|nr:antibiotic biosynthesis monooxygenase [Bacteroidales bacterium]